MVQPGGQDQTDKTLEFQKKLRFRDKRKFN